MRDPFDDLLGLAEGREAGRGIAGHARDREPDIGVARLLIDDDRAGERVDPLIRIDRQILVPRRAPLRADEDRHRGPCLSAVGRAVDHLGLENEVVVREQHDIRATVRDPLPILFAADPLLRVGLEPVRRTRDRGIHHLQIGSQPHIVGKELDLGVSSADGRRRRNLLVVERLAEVPRSPHLNAHSPVRRHVDAVRVVDVDARLGEVGRLGLGVHRQRVRHPGESTGGRSDARTRRDRMILRTLHGRRASGELVASSLKERSDRTDRERGQVREDCACKKQREDVAPGHGSSFFTIRAIPRSCGPEKEANLNGFGVATRDSCRVPLSGATCPNTQLEFGP